MRAKITDGLWLGVGFALGSHLVVDGGAMLGRLCMWVLR